MLKNKPVNEEMVELLIRALKKKHSISTYEAIERLKGNRPFFGIPNQPLKKGDACVNKKYRKEEVVV